MAKDINAARSDLNLGFFTDSETDWVFSKLIVSQCCTEAAGLGECLHAARQIDQKSQESWVGTWQSLAERVETQAREYISLGLQESARLCFLRASTYYHAAERGALPQEARFHALWRASRNAYLSAMELSPFEFRTISVQVDDHDLPGYFIPAESGKRAPTVIIAGGNDSSLEMITTLYGRATINRWLNLFNFDHPGHRGAVHLHPECVKRPDYEVPYGKAIDVLCEQPEVTEQIGIAGLSFGGGYRSPGSQSRSEDQGMCGLKPACGPMGDRQGFLEQAGPVEEAPSQSAVCPLGEETHTQTHRQSLQSLLQLEQRVRSALHDRAT